jgi:protein TonB
MGVLSQKLRSGLLQLSTDTGSYYACPSFRERVYLLWTFRNFRRLSVQVLNQRQRQLVDRLCEESPLLQHRPVFGSHIIGVVENVHLNSVRKKQPVSAGKVVEMIPMPRAVGSEGITVRAAAPPRKRPGIALFERRSAELGALARQKVSRAAAPLPLRRWLDRNLKWVLVGIFPVVLLAIFLETRYSAPQRAALAAPEVPSAATKPVSAAATPESEKAELAAKREAVQAPSKPTVVAEKPSAAVTVQSARPASAAASVAAPPLSAPALSRQNGEALVVALQPPPATLPNLVAFANVNSVPQSSAIASRPDESNGRGAVAVAQPAPAQPPAPAPKMVSERVRISAAPQSFDYPVAPNSRLTGKVSLRIVIAPDGSVSGVDVLSGHPTLAEAAVRAVRRWRYRPPQLNGRATEAESDVTISFAGEDAVTIAYR